MKIINLQQGTDEWKLFRKGKITGTKSSDCLSMTRKSADGSLVRKGWWELLAERLTTNEKEDTSNDARERGHELEQDCAELTVAKFNLKNPKYDCGVWQSDNENIILSPDCYEDCDKPTWAIECKALNSADHLKTIYRALEYNFDVLPEERFSVGNYDMCATDLYKIPQDYKEQALDYFIVNEDLQTLYFSLYDPRFENPKLIHWVFVIKREDIESEINNLKSAQDLTLKEIDRIVKIIDLALANKKENK